MEIIIGADLVPTKTNLELFSTGNVDKLFGKELLIELEKADMRIFNLETPLIERENPIKKAGPTLGISKEAVVGIKKINPSFLTLANNHIMDHGCSGLKSTVETLEENNIYYGGVGENEEVANSLWIKDYCGKKIGIYTCTEHEFSVASISKPGANPFDYINSYECIERNKTKCDFIIVLYHGGKEYYPYPTPELQKRCRYFIDKGADIVVCQHSHCIGCEETYKTKKIVYGQGNFLFDKTNREEWNHGLLLKLKIDNHNSYVLNYIALTKDNNCIRKATSSEYDEIIEKYKDRSREILDNSFIEKNYKKFSEANICSVLERIDLLPNFLIVKIFNKITKKKILKFYFEKIYLRKMSYKLVNTIECEAWNELLRQVLTNYNK